MVSGEHRAYTRRYSIASPANSPSAPIRRIRSGASRNKMPPIRIPAAKIRIQAHVKILFASFSFPAPRAIEIGTAEPTPIRSAREKLMTTKGMARLMAANAVAPRNCPTNTPSMVRYSALASMLTAPGTEARKNSFSGGVFENNSTESIGPFYTSLPNLTSPILIK